MPLIAETGGINAMIVDATALPEQVTDDVVTSAFRSAGQRCSALRLLCLQDDVAERIAGRLASGNVYVNRSMIGAVVGTQPFGGTHLSGTGPKAGGPNYLRRFAAEQTITVNTAAAGGNASLLAQEEL